MILIENYKKVVFQNYASFEGRATRSEYWYFFLANIIIGFILGLIEGILGIADDSGQSVLANIYTLIILLPAIGVSIRRVHDSDKSGWFVLVPLYNLYLMIIKGTEGTNRFGEDSLGGTSAPPPSESQNSESQQNEEGPTV